MNRAAVAKRLEAIEADVDELARRLLPPSAPDPDDPQTLTRYLTCEELERLENAFRRVAEGEPVEDEAAAVWDDARRRAVARMVTGVDVKALDDKEQAGRVLVRIPLDEPPIPGRTRLIGYLPDQMFPDQWNIENIYTGALPRTLSTAELRQLGPTPWPPGSPRCST